MASTLFPMAASASGRDADPETRPTEKPLSTEGDNETKPEEPTKTIEGLPLVLLIIGLILSVFCLGLDRTILATAIPKITSEFDSLEDVAWYGSSYLLTTCCFQLMYGKLYAEFHITWVFMAALGMFELGSIVCGAAPNSIALIIGRAVAGIGCAGILSGTFIIIAQAIPLHKRPVYTGIIGGMSGIAQVIAPALGGAFTDHIGWRWCFWINLPLGAVTAVVVFFFVQLPRKPKTAKSQGIGALVASLDLWGTAVFIPWMICLLLALEWGGTTYAWSNWRMILCLTLFAVLFLAWLFIQHSRGDAATLPLRIARQRSVASGMMFSLGIGGSLFLVVYYVSIWFQAVKNDSAQNAGINFFTSSASMSVASVISGFLVTKIGYYVPQMFFSTTVISIASGLIYTFDLDTSTAYWAGTLVMFGFGVGIGMQMPISAVQTVLASGDISLGTSVLVLAQTLSGAIFLAVGQNLFGTKLLEELVRRAPNVNPAVVVANGVSGLKDAITEQYGADTATAVLQAYNEALRQCFLVCVILSCLTIVGGLGMQWKSVKTSNKMDEKKESPDVESQAAGTDADAESEGSDKTRQYAKRT